MEGLCKARSGLKVAWGIGIGSGQLGYTFPRRVYSDDSRRYMMRRAALLRFLEVVINLFVLEKHLHETIVL